MIAKLTIATFVLSILPFGAAEADQSAARDYHKHWRMETPNWEIIRRQRAREALQQQLAPRAEPVPEKRDVDRPVEPNPQRHELFI